VLNAVFVGQSENLPLAFPRELREEVSSRLHVLPFEFEGEGWRGHAGALREVDYIFATWGMPRLDEAFLAAVPRLKAVFYAAGSIKSFVTPEAYDRGIHFTSAWEENAIPVAEYTYSAIMLSLKNFWTYMRQCPEKKFTRGGIVVNDALNPPKVGIVSLGVVGRNVADRLALNDMGIFAYDPHAPAHVTSESRVTMVSLEDLFSLCDVVSIHAPLLPETENLITGALVFSMKQGATLINTSRGAVLDEPAVCKVLAVRPDITAILDVTNPEPPSADSPLRTLENVILTPHIAGSLGWEIARMGRRMVDEMHHHLDGRPLRHSISREMLSLMA